MNLPSPEAIALNWWRGLQPNKPNGDPNPTADRATLARLRRAPDPTGILGERRVLDLYGRLGYSRGQVEELLPWVAVTAMVLAHVREHDPGRNPPRAVGPKRGDGKGETARLKPLRFRRLLLTRDPPDVARDMRRLVDLADHSKLDVGKLAGALLSWGGPRGDNIRTLWAYDYYDAGDSAPVASFDEAAPAL